VSSKQDYFLMFVSQKVLQWCLDGVGNAHLKIEPLSIKHACLRTLCMHAENDFHVESDVWLVGTPICFVES